MKKNIVICFIVLLSGSLLFSKPWDIYDGANQDTLNKIKSCDEFIEKKAYLTAAGQVVSCEDEYIIYKYVEVCTNYFVLSLNHQLFSFKNLEKDEDLLELRKNGGEFTQIVSDDIETLVQKCRKTENVNEVVLDLALANYYYDAINRYGNNWIKQPQDVLEFILNAYDKALEEEVYDVKVLENYFSLCLNLESYDKAEICGELLTQKFPENGRYWFNYSVALMYLSKYKEAIPVVKNAIKYPEKEIEYQFDYYSLLSDAYAYSGDLENAEKVLIDSTKKFSKDYRSFYLLGTFYIVNSEYYDLKKAEKNFMKALSIKSDDETVYRIIEVFYNCNLMSDAIDFCNKAIKSQKDDNVKGYLYYYQSQMMFLNIDGELTEQNCSEIEEVIEKAESCFEKSKNEAWLNDCMALRQGMLGV